MTEIADSGPRWTLNRRDASWTCPAQTGEALEFHRALDGYAPTALIELPTLAEELGVGRVFAKEESSRLGLPAFKALGASWAVHRALGTVGASDAEVVTATDGNHGRAVARFARLSGQAARIFVPVGGIHPAAVSAIRDEGAAVVEHPGNYDATVAAAARFAADTGGVLVQDTAWDGYVEVPGWIVDGYSTLFEEIDAQLQAAGLGGPDLVFVPTGVGSLLQAALAHYRAANAVRGTGVIAVEPVTAACVSASLDRGHPVTVETGETIMSGLNCGTPSSLAWPFIRHGLDAAAAVGEQDAIAAVHRLAELGVDAGPCGAAALAGARLALLGDGADSRRRQLDLGPESTIVLTITEGSGANPVPAS